MSVRLRFSAALRYVVMGTIGEDIDIDGAVWSWRLELLYLFNILRMSVLLRSVYTTLPSS